MLICNGISIAQQDISMMSIQWIASLAILELFVLQQLMCFLALQLRGAPIRTRLLKVLQSLVQQVLQLSSVVPKESLIACALAHHLMHLVGDTILKPVLI
jgi:hypothetical protein